MIIKGLYMIFRNTRSIRKWIICTNISF